MTMKALPRWTLTPEERAILAALVAAKPKPEPTLNSVGSTILAYEKHESAAGNPIGILISPVRYSGVKVQDVRQGDQLRSGAFVFEVLSVLHVDQDHVTVEMRLLRGPSKVAIQDVFEVHRKI